MLTHYIEWRRVQVVDTQFREKGIGQLDVNSQGTSVNMHYLTPRQV